MTSGFEITRQANTHLRVETASPSKLSVDHILWFAREAQKAVDAGMDPKTLVDVTNSGGGSRLIARQTISQAIQ